MSNEPRHTIVVALEVTDADTYERYRTGMRPILAEFGGRFDWDFRGGEVLTSPDAPEVNRVFALSFPDRAQRVAFFADPGYVEVRKEFFDASVAQVHIVTEPSD
ncbi:MAG: DUF1330 domain-containing protein [Nannocystaceae bacterium]|nr:DUF1330 domain-containing protein [Nannocystaceae bacterium]